MVNTLYATNPANVKESFAVRETYRKFNLVKPTIHTAHAYYQGEVIKAKSIKQLKLKIDARYEADSGAPEVTQAPRKTLRNTVVPKVTVTSKSVPAVPKVTEVPEDAPVELGKPGTIKHLAITLIVIGTPDVDIIARVCAMFPNSKFSANHLVWYRSTLTRDGILSHRHAPKQSKRYKAWKAKHDLTTAEL